MSSSIHKAHNARRISLWGLAAAADRLAYEGYLDTATIQLTHYGLTYLVIVNLYHTSAAITSPARAARPTNSVLRCYCYYD